MKNGVYQIRNVKNGKIYIGSVAELRGFDHRWRTHCLSLDKGNHHSVYLQRAWKKYGADVFVFEILEICEPSLCIDREQHYLDTLLFASYDDDRFDELGYNMCRVAGSRLGVKHTAASRAKMSLTRKGRPLSVKHCEALSGEKNHFYGKHHTIASKQLLAKAHIKLSEEEVQQIRILLQNGHKQSDLAERFGVTQQTISNIHRGKRNYYLQI